MPAIAGRENSNTMRTTGAAISPREAATNAPAAKTTKASAKPTRDATRQLKYVPTAQPPNKTAMTENKITPSFQASAPSTTAHATAPRAMSASQLTPTRVSTRAVCNFLTGVQDDATVDIGCALGGGVHRALASSLSADRDACGGVSA